MQLDTREMKSTFLFIHSLFSLALFPLSCLEMMAADYYPVVINKIPHEFPAYTQGLAIEGDALYESTGLYGQSGLKQIDIKSGRVLRKASLPSRYFGEGLAVFPHVVYQISWREGSAFVYDLATLNFKKIISYQGEGWGLCRDGESIWMSNGSSQLIKRDRNFAIIGRLNVVKEGKEIAHLNALECVENHIFANLWLQEKIIQIDKHTGEVKGVIDASSLLSSDEKEQLGRNDVLNGIAFRPKTRTFFLTGKNWPWIFEVELYQKK